jgi:hypothetical protein
MLQSSKRYTIHLFIIIHMSAIILNEYFVKIQLIFKLNEFIKHIISIVKTTIFLFKYPNKCI